jgi:hemoglobin-like flavoprotein
LVTPGEIELIQRSFERVAGTKIETGQLFYDRLFFIAPELRPMFSTDIRVQSSKLMDTLAYAIGQLPDGPNLAATLQKLGRRHLDYGVKPEHYDKVGEALIWTMEKLLADDWTPELQASWASLYANAAKIMKEAAYSSAA